MTHFHGEPHYVTPIKTTTTNLGGKPSSTNRDNPPFIYPGTTTHDLSKPDGGPYKPLRGYIRRLNEFYKKMGIESSSIDGRKCNFQFQPETVVRNVAGNSYDTQYFFNQEPGQLTVPIPGQSTFSMKLLFNREAEVTSKKYLTKNGKVESGATNTLQESLATAYGTNIETESPFVSGAFNQSWVTKLGVLADIMVLDAVIGQGINSETVAIIQKIAEKAKETAEKNTAEIGATLTDRQVDAQDKNELTGKAAAFWIGQSEENPNLGNQAFLVPTPVRVVLSNNMIVEGFVLQSAVNFHKFSKTFIPTQATVELSIQALYIGFAKKTTMLSQEVPPEDDAGPDTKPTAEMAADVDRAVTQGLTNFYVFRTKESPIHINPNNNDLLHYLLTEGEQQAFNFQFELTKAGIVFRNEILNDGAGGNISFTWEGSITLQWDSFVNNAANNRTMARTSATTAGNVAVTYTKVNSGTSSPNNNGMNYLGTAETPYVFASGFGEMNEVTKGFALRDSHSIIAHVIGKAPVNNGVFSGAEDALWTIPDRPTAVLFRPFEQDKFKVTLEIQVILDHSGIRFPVPQKIKSTKIITAGNVPMLQNLTFESLATGRGSRGSSGT